MFQSLLNNNNLSSEEVKNALNEILVKAQQNPQDVSQSISDLQEFDKISKYLAQYWNISIQIALQILTVEECYQFMNQQQSNSSLKLIVFLDKQLFANKCQILLKLSEKHGSIHKQLVILKMITNNSVQIIQPQTIPFLFPKIVRLEAFILQKYFKVKNQPANDSSDYLQNDLKMVTNCQNWVAKCLKLGFEKLPQVEHKSVELKSAVIVCISEIYGALIQALRENNLNKQLINQIISEMDSYLFRNYSLREIYRKYLKDLRKVNFENLHQKLLIKEAYTPDMKLNDPGFGHIVLKYLECSCLVNNIKLTYLLPALAQNINNPYPIKLDLQKEIESILATEKNSITVTGQYPVQLFLFYIQEYAKQAFQSMRNKLVPTEKESLLNSLIILRQIKLGDSSLHTKRDTYILNQVQKNELLSLPRSLILLRIIKLEGVNSQIQEKLLSYLNKYKTIHGIKPQFQDVITRKIQESEPAFQNELKKILNSN